jgi:two-component system nitrate/nitrite response regulator NarL
LVMLGEAILPTELLSNLSRQIKDPRDVRRVERRPEKVLCILPKLSLREECILRCIAEGDPNKIIARKMGIADATVKVHVKAILRKIGVENRTQAAIWSKRSFQAVQALAWTEDKDEMA